MTCEHKFSMITYSHRKCKKCGMEQIQQWLDIPKGAVVGYV